ncbi:FtsQ-type POTRA domain-containing protein [Lactobacillus sp. LC28-10]|uniref:Cell division protein DivIB n=1 Tax=Secundilactobacillus angelensis TaxID=2722706 RepID=A0ABX1KYF9_9LACO|nr:cell division protein FtsQ/DivIB [Secundilactobacillus angelensis]MCH5463133.1 FtsQ-type POTRA domain-containing protein [Secundilactobacillus angelensis]NLR18986.1 FtsQ-type POTRA domain-containing protein [Secundilactobacillus angelensis]
MSFKINRDKSKRRVAITPWEKYQSEERQRAAKKTNRVQRIGAKLPRLKQQKHRRLAQRMGILLGIFGLILIVSGYYVSPLSHIGRINVSGNHALSDQQVVKMSGVSHGDSIYRVIGKEQQLAKQVRKSHPRVDQISFSVAHFNRLTIRVKEYPTAGFVPANGYYRVALTSGVISKERQKQPSGSYPVYDKFKSSKQLSQMIRQYAKLSKKIQNGISEIQFSPTKANPERVHLYMNDGNEVYASISTFASKMAYYPSIAAKMSHKGIVNLEIGAYSYSF